MKATGTAGPAGAQGPEGPAGPAGPTYNDAAVLARMAAVEAAVAENKAAIEAGGSGMSDTALALRVTELETKQTQTDVLLAHTNLSDIGAADVGNYLQATAEGQADWRAVSGASGGGSPAIMRHAFIGAQAIIAANLTSTDGAAINSYSTVDDLSRNADGVIDLTTRTISGKTLTGYLMDACLLYTSDAADE